MPRPKPLKVETDQEAEAKENERRIVVAFVSGVWVAFGLAALATVNPAAAATAIGKKLGLM